jgi:hypothetical protein
MRFRRGVADEHVSTRNPARFVALILGAAAIVFGAIAAADTGFDPDHIYRPHETVMTFHHTPLLAVGEIAFGAALLISAAGTYLGRTLMTSLSVGALGLGVVVVADKWPHRLHDWLGVHDRGGWLFVAVGAIGLGATALLPVTRRKHVVEREEVPVAR